jgi:hypothetical protein
LLSQDRSGAKGWPKTSFAFHCEHKFQNEREYEKSGGPNNALRQITLGTGDNVSGAGRDMMHCRVDEGSTSKERHWCRLEGRVSHGPRARNVIVNFADRGVGAGALGMFLGPESNWSRREFQIDREKGYTRKLVQ